MSECQHMLSVPVPEPEPGTNGCEECLAIGQRWVHLRKCLVCGPVGCCDSSIGKHATKPELRCFWIGLDLGDLVVYLLNCCRIVSIGFFLSF